MSKLGNRAHAVLEAFLTGRDSALHPDDRAEAAAFWGWLGEFERPGPAVVPARFAWPRVAVAAVAALAILGTSFLMLRPTVALEPGQSVATVHAERRRMELSDGSTIILAPNSRVDVAFARNERRLRLVAGEALFTVAHDKTRPFIVETGQGNVVAVGTVFDVSLGKGEAKVSVVEGVVRVTLPESGRSSAGEPREKMARMGERLSFGVMDDARGGTGFIRKAADVDPQSAVAWTQGRLIFHGEPLSEVIAEVNRYSKDRLVLADPRRASLPVYGVVDQGDTGAIRDLIANPDAVAIEQRTR